MSQTATPMYHRHLSTTRQARPRRGQPKGTSVLEMALVLPVLMLLLLGTIDFSRVFYAAIAVTDAARAGVQFGSQSAATSTDFAGMEAAAQSAAQNLVPTPTATASRYCQCSDGTVVDCVTGNCGAEGAPQLFVRVDAQYMFTTFFPYPGIPNSVSLTRTARMRVN